MYECTHSNTYFYTLPLKVITIVRFGIQLHFLIVILYNILSCPKFSTGCYINKKISTSTLSNSQIPEVNKKMKLEFPLENFKPSPMVRSKQLPLHWIDITQSLITVAWMLFYVFLYLYLSVNVSSCNNVNMKTMH